MTTFVLSRPLFQHAETWPLRTLVADLGPRGAPCEDQALVARAVLNGWPLRKTLLRRHGRDFVVVGDSRVVNALVACHGPGCGVWLDRSFDFEAVTTVPLTGDVRLDLLLAKGGLSKVIHGQGLPEELENRLEHTRNVWLDYPVTVQLVLCSDEEADFDGWIR
jgi:hypothetical protein